MKNTLRLRKVLRLKNTLRLKKVLRLMLLCAGPIGCNPPAEKAPECPPCAEVQEKASEPPEPAPVLAGALKFVTSGGDSQVILAQQLVEIAPLENIVSEDPNYRAKKSFSALSLAPLLLKYFEQEKLEETTMRLVATDGYTVEILTQLLLSGDAYLAVGEGEPGRFSPMGPQAADAGPFYLVWKGDDYTDDKKFPRPWALVSIEVIDKENRSQHTRPEEGFSGNASAEAGYGLFAASCIRCHAINREGGRVGPDLNVPQNILAYRPEEQVRAYILNPQAFRYSNMPAHPELTKKDMDAIISYLRLMADHQHDPEAN